MHERCGTERKARNHNSNITQVTTLLLFYSFHFCVTTLFLVKENIPCHFHNWAYVYKVAVSMLFCVRSSHNTYIVLTTYVHKQPFIKQLKSWKYLLIISIKCNCYKTKVTTHSGEANLAQFCLFQNILFCFFYALESFLFDFCNCSNVLNEGY